MPPKVTKAQLKKARTAVMKKKNGTRKGSQVRDALGGSVSAPVSVSRSRRGAQPSISGSGNRVIVRHREFFMDVVSPASSAFTAASYPINPGVATLFPWLSILGGQFEKYRFRSLTFEYEGRCATSNPGSLILAIDFDASDPAPATKQQVCSYRTFTDDVPWKASTMRAPAADLQWEKYVRNGVVSGTDIKLYDLGNLMVCTQGAAVSTALGELFVSYEIELITPQVSSILGGQVQGFTSMTAAMPFGLAPVVQFNGSLPFVVGNNGVNTTLTFSQPWEGVLAFQITGTVVTNLVVANLAGAPAATLYAIYPFLVNAAGTTASEMVEVRAVTNSVLTVIATATTVTSPFVIAASVSYANL